VTEEVDEGAAGAQEREVDVGGDLQTPGDQVARVDGLGVPLDEDCRDGVKADDEADQGEIEREPALSPENVPYG